MLSFLAALALAPPIDQPPRLRTILPNGSISLIEPHFESKLITIELVASARGAEDTPKTHGWRHILEHLLVRGRDGRLDSKLEAVGGFLRAETYRDATVIEIQVPPDQLDAGLAAVEEVLHEPKISAEQIAREIPILKNEIALEDDAAILANAGWHAAYGDQGLDPQGETDLMAGAKPEDLVDLYLRLLRSGNVAIGISGPIDLDGGTKKATALLARLPGAPNKDKFRPRIAAERRTIEASAHGGAVAVDVLAYDSPKSAASLAAAFGLATKLDAFVTYTPSVRNAVITIGSGNSEDFLKRVAGLSDADIDDGYEIGVALARSWVQRQLERPAAAIKLRTMLMAEDPNAKPELLLANLQRVGLAEFRVAAQSIKTGYALEGTK